MIVFIPIHDLEYPFFFHKILIYSFNLQIFNIIYKLCHRIRFDSRLTFSPLIDELKRHYNFPCLNSLSDTNIKKLQTIQNSAVRYILKLRFDTPSSILYHEAQNKLKFHTISNRLFELSERYVRAGLTNSVPLLLRLVNEYRRGFESRFVNYPTPLCNCYLELTLDTDLQINK
ncbi:hypothetical protein BpHYR1_028684 [Brachionus plicatilis]|uniref:Uncharacterized protein n=1 Tax=Brachionus plicatilis TaxID=10195 RepID=A0A3M7PDA5_BRAPC|nr:hypothetical protein BpHYR1_028684 [Brachionus plicatilis]